MYFTHLYSIINIAVLGIHVFVQLVAAILLSIKRSQSNDRSWKFLFLFFSTSAIAALGEIIIILTAPAMLDAYKIMSPIVIACGFLIFVALMFYLIEMMNPHWITPKRIIWIMTPWLLSVMSLAIFSIFDETTVLYRINDIWENLHRSDVYIRLILCFLFIPYAIWLLYLPYNWRRSIASRKLLIILVCSTAMMCITYIGSRGLQIFPIYLIHESLYLAITILILYVEFYERLHIPLETVKSYYTPTDNPILTTSERTIEHTIKVLQELMDDPEVWQNPDLVRDDLVKMAGSNRTYIEIVAKRMGFKNLADMVHRRRIDYACQQLRENPQTNLQSLFYDAGYRSRTTAWRHFVEIVGCTPTEFVEKNTPPRKRITHL